MDLRTQIKSSIEGISGSVKNQCKFVNILSLLFLLLLSNTALSGAWVSKVGSGYNKYATTLYNADEYFGDNDTSVDFSGQNFSFYGEYGFAPKLAVYGTLLYQRLEQTDSARETTKSNGFSDAELGLRYQWQAEPFVLSTSLLVKLPYLYDKQDALPRGNGQEDYEVRILIGKSLYPFGYLGFETAYRLRTESPSDEYRYLLEYGFSANDNLYFRTKLDSIISAKNADAQGGSTNVSIAPEYDLTKIEITAGWNLGSANKDKERWGVEVTYRQDLTGDNTIKGDGIEIGVTRVF